jgi:hypothetical protein
MRTDAWGAGLGGGLGVGSGSRSGAAAAGVGTQAIPPLPEIILARAQSP